MIRGLQITIRGEELTRRVAERIRAREDAIGLLDARIEQRAGDGVFDVRPEDNFKTLGELEKERQDHRDTLLRLTLLRNGLDDEQRYSLTVADLRLADLISADVADATVIASGAPDDRRNDSPIDGLKLTIPGDEVRTLLDVRIADHRRRVAWWKRELARTPEEQTDEEPLLPDHICQNEAERHEWRVDVLAFIRDHIESTGTYRVGEADLTFAELLPEKPGSLEQVEYKERTSVGFNLERLAKRVDALSTRELVFAANEPRE
jgi:hypothetical protein